MIFKLPALIFRTCASSSTDIDPFTTALLLEKMSYWTVWSRFASAAFCFVWFWVAEIAGSSWNCFCLIMGFLPSWAYIVWYCPALGGLWAPAASAFFWSDLFLVLASVLASYLALGLDASDAPMPEAALGLLCALRPSKNALAAGPALLTGVIVFKVDEIALSMSLIYYYYN